MATLGLNKDYFEKVLFKALVKDSSVMGLLSDFVKPEVFENSAMRACMDFFLNFYKEHCKLPSKSEINMFMDKSDIQKLNELWKTEEMREINLAEIEKRIFFDQAEQFLKERQAMLAMMKIAERMGKNHQLDPSELVTLFERVAAIKVMQDKGFDIYDDVDAFLVRSNENEERIPTGFSKIDENIGGGALANGKFLGVVAAPPNMGKSIMLGNLATNAVQAGKNVLLITLEMSEDVYASRIYSSLYDMPIADLCLMGDELKENIHSNNFGRMLIKEFPPASMTVENIDGYIDGLYKSGMKFDMIVLDYLTLIKAVGAENSNDAGKIVARKLRALTYKYEIPLWTACQINRKGMEEKKGVPDMSFIAESISIAAESDLILGLYQEAPDNENSIMRVWFMKSRFGNNGFGVELNFNRRSLKFEDIKEQSDTDAINRAAAQSVAAPSRFGKNTEPEENSGLQISDIFGKLG